MIAHARRAAEVAGSNPFLAVQALHELDLPRRYRTAFMIGVFEIGGDRTTAREALHRAYEALEPGGALVINHELPYHSPDDVLGAVVAGPPHRPATTVS